jgi:predicted nuclease of predicted toxin-antitoxin system
MRIKLDENIPASLVNILAGLGHDADSVPEEGLGGFTDPDIWRAAQQESRFLITQDLDFSDIRRFQPGTHHGILLVRLKNPGRLALIKSIKAVFQSETVSTWSGCFVVLSETKLRIRRPVA